jgi:UDP-N-acetylglucosamine transferase subunit ALG13
VINDKLLDNHQNELADAMENHSYMLIARRPEHLPSVLTSRLWEETRLYPDPDPSLFLNELSTLVQLG